MATKDVAPVLAKEFVFAELDFDRGVGAKDVEHLYTDKEQGLPWLVFVDGDVKALIDSDIPAGQPHAGNIGHPNQPYEVDHFKTMLKKVQKHLTDKEIDTLIASLVEFNRIANGGK